MIPPTRQARTRFPGKWLFLATMLLAWGLCATAGEVWVFFGTYTNGLSRGIYVSRLNDATGQLSAPSLAAETPSPCFLAVSPNQKFLYAANSVTGFSDYSVENGGAVSAFAIDPQTGRLKLLNQACSGGLGPCHVSVDATGKVLFVANYGSGSVKAFLLATNGAIGAGGDCVRRIGHSANSGRQEAAHAHFIRADPSNHFALVCDLGTDEVVIYPFDPVQAGLHPSRFEAFSVPPGAGARHLAFSPDGRHVHVINELACTITTFAWDAAAGKLTALETVSALPPRVAVNPHFTAAEILAQGDFVYATIRGHDSISVLAADARTGRLTFRQNVASAGKTPRGLGLDPSGHWLFVGNQNSDNVLEFAVDSVTGLLSRTGRAWTIGSPVDVKFASP